MSRQILFLIPHMHLDEPLASNIWAKNLAKSFALAGFLPTVLYLGSKAFSKKKISGVTYLSIPLYQSLMVCVPKLRSAIVPFIQQRYIKKHGSKYEVIAPLRGPYDYSSELDKISAVKTVGAKYLLTVVEHPKRNAASDDPEVISQYLRKTANLYDIVMPITTCIRDMYIEHGRTKPILLNPIIVDISSYHTNEASSYRKIKQFLYCGNLAHSEEMEILFREFSLVIKEYPDIQLVVIGGVKGRKKTNELIAKYKLVCRTLCIENVVSFKGYISHNAVLEFYSEADAFLLPRPFREYSKAGFPSKIGEYLATGKPVIAYGTGDMPLFLEDGVSAYLVSDETKGKFAKKIIEVIQDNHSHEVGNSGRAVAEKKFSIAATAERIRVFFQ